MTIYIPTTGISFNSILAMPLLTNLVPIGSAYIPYINFVDALTAAAFTALVPGTPNTNFAATFSGQFLVTLGGAYTFCIASDDGSTLSVDGSLVVNNSATHGSRNLCSSAITLSAGLHSIYAYYFQAGGYVQTQVTYSGPDTSNSKVLVQFNATGPTTCTACVSGTFSDSNGTSVTINVWHGIHFAFSFSLISLLFRFLSGASGCAFCPVGTYSGSAGAATTIFHLDCGQSLIVQILNHYRMIFCIFISIA